MSAAHAAAYLVSGRADVLSGYRVDAIDEPDEVVRRAAAVTDGDPIQSWRLELADRSRDQGPAVMAVGRKKGAAVESCGMYHYNH